MVLDKLASGVLTGGTGRWKWIAHQAVGMQHEMEAGATGSSTRKNRHRSSSSRKINYGMASGRDVICPHIHGTTQAVRRLFNQCARLSCPILTLFPFHALAWLNG